MIRCPRCATGYAVGTSCPGCGHAVATVNGFPAWAPEAASPGEGFKEDYFAPLADVEAGNFWFRGRNRLIVWALKRYFPSMRSFLEVGCGTGFVLSGIAAAFPQVALAGSEMFAGGLAFASRRVPRAAFMQMDARRIPYEEEFDVAGAFDVIEHVEQDEVVLAALARAVRPGGGVLLTVPQHEWLWSASDEYACHVRRYSARDLHAKVERAGLRILRSTSFVSLLLPAMYASRRRSSLGERFDPVQELRLSPALNWALERALRVELALIGAGLSLPAGGSRLVVATKP